MNMDSSIGHGDIITKNIIVRIDKGKEYLSFDLHNNHICLLYGYNQFITSQFCINDMINIANGESQKYKKKKSIK